MLFFPPQFRANFPLQLRRHGQVFYLERLDSERPQPQRRPRIAAYDNETLRARIEQDRRPVRREGGLKPFGNLRVHTKHYQLQFEQSVEDPG